MLGVVIINHTVVTVLNAVAHDVHRCSEHATEKNTKNRRTFASHGLGISSQFGSSLPGWIVILGSILPPKSFLFQANWHF
jgi:hypothetical protein